MARTRVTTKEKLSLTKKPVTSRKKGSMTKSAKKVRAPESSLINAEEREQMIAEAAYYRAEQHGFDASQQLDDWLKAEASIDTMLTESAKLEGTKHH